MADRSPRRRWRTQANVPSFDLAAGVRFQCQGSGKCCTFRGERRYVYVTLADRRRLAAELGRATRSFTLRYCDKTDGRFHLKANRRVTACIFLEDNRCRVYGARPSQCRTWPFWPELLNAISWREEVAPLCCGVGKGRRFSAREITDIAAQQSVDDQAL